MFKIDPKKKIIILIYTLFIFSTVFHVFSRFFGQSSRFEFIVPISKFTLLCSIPNHHVESNDAFSRKGKNVMCGSPRVINGISRVTWSYMGKLFVQKSKSYLEVHELFRNSKDILEVQES